MRACLPDRMVEECFDGALRPLTEGFSRPRTPVSGVSLATSSRNGLHQTGLQRRFANGGSTALRVQRGQRGRRGAFRLHPAAVSVTLSEKMLTNILVNILIYMDIYHGNS